MEMTLGELFEAETALTRLATERLPVKTAYRVAKLTKLVRAEVEIFVNQRNALIREMGEERDSTSAERAMGMDPRVVTVRAERKEEYFRRLNELTTIAVSLDYDPLPLEMLEGISIPAADLLLLGPLVKD